MNDWLSVNVRTVSTKNVATAPISSVRPGVPVTRPITNDSDRDRERHQHREGEGDVTD